MLSLDDIMGMCECTEEEIEAIECNSLYKEISQYGLQKTKADVYMLRV